jgi:hypothetical protein
MASLYTLPNKLLLNVAKFLDKPDLLKLALTCRKFTSIAQDVLYDAPELQDYYSTPITTTIQRIRDLGRTLLRRPDLARKVRELTVVAVDGTHSTIELGTMELAGQILGEIARYSPQLTANVEDWIHRLREGRGVAWVGLILAIAPRLSSLTIEINRGRSTGRWDTKRYAPDPQEHLFGHIATTYDMAVFFPLDLSAIPGLQHLKTLRFHAAELALNWCLLPDLKTLTLPRNCHREFDGSYASRIAPSGIHGCSKVSAMNAELPTSLTRQLDENDYSALSSSFLCSETFPSLRSLHIKLTNAYRWTPSNGILRERAPWPHVRYALSTRAPTPRGHRTASKFAPGV